MGKESEIKRIIKSISNSSNGDILFEAIVKKVNANNTINVEYQGLLHENVRLSAGFSGNKNVLVAQPKVGSLVLVADISEGKMRDLIVLMQEETEKIIFNDGKFGGLIKIEELTTKINAIEKQMNDLKTILKNWTPAAQDGGLALKTALTKWLTNADLKTETKEIEDATFLH